MRQVISLVSLLFLLACSTTRNEPLMLTFTGAYQSLEDRSDQLACYCETGGYIDACGGLWLPICFETQETAEGCLNITIEGYYEYLPPSLPLGSDCPSEELRVFMVTDWKCRD